MPDQKISQLTALTTAVSADLLAIVDTTANPDETKKITLGNAVGSGLATITGLTAATAMTTDDLLPVVDDPAGTPAAKKITYQNFLNSLTALTALSATSSDDIVLIVDDPAGTPTAKKITIANLVPAVGLVLLEQHTASASASLDFTTCITSTYDEYQIEIVNVVPATDNVSLYFRVSTDGGSTYDISNLYAESNWGWTNSGSGVSGTAIGAPTSQIYVSSSGDTLDNAATYGLVGSFKLYSPLSTSLYKLLVGQVALLNNSGFVASLSKVGYYKSTTAVNAFRFIMSSGNIASGTIRVYGVSK